MQREQARLQTARWRRCADARNEVAGDGILRRHDHVAVAVADQRIARPGQQRLEDGQCLLTRHRLRGGEGHITLHARDDRIVLMQQVAEDGLDHGLDRLVLEIEGNGARTGVDGLRLGQAHGFDELARTRGDVGLRGRRDRRIDGTDRQRLGYRFFSAGQRLSLQRTIVARLRQRRASGKRYRQRRGADQGTSQHETTYSLVGHGTIHRRLVYCRFLQL